MLFVFLYLLWIIFNARVTAEVALIGLPVVGLVYAFSLRGLDWSLRRDLALFKSLPALLLFLLALLKDIILSALRVIRLIWSRRAPEPKLVSFDPSLKTETGRVLLSDAITLTPGTVTAELSGGSLRVHCLEKQSASQLAGSAPLVQIRRLEEKGGAHE